jgi:nitroreductase
LNKQEAKEYFLNLMNERHACKLFDKNKKISQEDLDYILELGRLSPSSFGMEQWHFLIIRDEVLKEKLQPACWNQPQITTSSELIVLLAKKQLRSTDEYIQNRVAKKNIPEDKKAGHLERFGNFIDIRGDNDILHWANAQVYIASANMMTGAMAIGIDSCAIEGFEKEKVEHILGIDTEKYSVAMLLPFGYRVNPKKEKDRLDISEITTYIN